MFQSVWIWDAFALIGHVCVWPGNKTLFFWSPTRFQSAWIWGSFAPIGHDCQVKVEQLKHTLLDQHIDQADCVVTWQQNAVVFLIIHQVPVCVDTGNKVLLLSTRFQSVWICGAFAVISCHCVWPDNKALLPSARFQSVWIQGTKHCYCLPGSSLCGYREQSIVIVCQVPVCVDTGNKALLLSARFQSVWIQGTKHCYCLPGSSLCGYREQSIVIVCQVPVCVDTGNKALLSSAGFQSVWIQGTKHCYCLPGSSLCGYGEPLLWSAANCFDLTAKCYCFLIIHQSSSLCGC